MSYSGDLSNPVDYVRFLIGDTYPAREALTDKEIQSLIDMNGGNLQTAAIAACNGAINKLNYLFNQSVGSVSVSYGDWAKNFIATLARLQTQQNYIGGYSAYSGGTSIADKFQVNSNPDRPARNFANDPRTAETQRSSVWGAGVPWRDGTW